MKLFEYPDIDTVSHNGMRWYETPNGMFYPSITTVLSNTISEEKQQSLQKWRDSLGAEEADRVSKAATDRGTNIHLLAERYFKNEQVDAPIDGIPVPAKDLGSFNALKMKFKNVNEVWGQEVALYSEDLEVAGRCDFVGVYKNKPSIIDFKTASRVKSHDDILDYKHQLAFYAKAHNQMFGTDIHTGVILMVADIGFPQEFIINLHEHYEDLAIRVKTFWENILNNSSYEIQG